MKAKIVSLGLALVSSLVSAQPVMTSYADVFPATESRLGSLTSIRKVEDTAAASAAYASFATKIVFPEGTTSVTFTAASFAVESWINNNYTIHNPTGVSMANSWLNPEGDVALPSIYGRTSTGTLIAPPTTNLVGNSFPAKTFFITEHKVDLSDLVNPGDYWVMYRSVSGTYVTNGDPIPFSVSGQSAKVILVNETNVPVNGVSQDYPNNPQTPLITVSGGVTTITATGVTVASHKKTWWMETSTSLDIGSWSFDDTATVSPDVTITFPYVPGDPKRFWRINGLKP